MYEGANSKYCKKDVIMCHGSNCKLDVRALRPVLGLIDTYMDQRCKKIQSERRQQGQDDISENSIAEKIRGSQGSFGFDHVLNAFESQKECRHLYT